VTDERSNEEREDGLADVDAGAFIGREAELTRTDMPVESELIATKIPDLGWQKPPEGHREATPVAEDELKRKVV
jgi:hypothetical protein